MFPGVVKAVTIWLDTVRALVLDQPLPAEATDLLAPSIRAAAGGAPDFSDVSAATQVWARAVAEHVDPALSEAFGEAFLDAARRADISPLPFQLEYLESVHDRLKIWPEDAFEELRPELLEMLSEGMDYEQMTERIGAILGIDAPTRRIRAEISAIDRLIDDPETTGADRKMLRARRRALWNQHDESLKEWQWKARRIARTECLPPDSPIDAAHITAVYRRHYEGQWIEVATGAGRKIAGTPNHPVLTVNGWKGLGDLTESDHLVCYLPSVESAGAARDQDVDHTPATIGEVFDAVAAVVVAEREATTEPDFHGDGREGYVDVLRPDWLLSVGRFAPLSQCGHDLSLTPSGLGLIRGAAERGGFARDLPVPHGVGLLKVADWDARAGEAALNRPFVDAVSIGERALRPARHVQRGQLGDIEIHTVVGELGGDEFARLRHRSSADTGLPKDAVDGGFVALEGTSKSGSADARVIQLDKVIRVDVGTYRGHVFNITTVDGYYSGPLGIVTSNTHGAIEGGALAAAQAVEAAGGQAMFKAWLATTDEKVRGTHAVADGQIVRLREPFRVGISELQHPGDPNGPAHEVIQCRCSTRYLRHDELQAELQGPFGGGGIGPRRARIGPDDVDDAAAALDRWQRIQRGEKVEEPQVTKAPEPETQTSPEPIRDTSPETDSETDAPADVVDEDLEDLHVGDDETDVADEVPGADERDSDTDRDPGDVETETDAATDDEPIVSDESRALLESARTALPDDGWDALSDEEVAAHAETARAVGASFWGDITTAMDRDATVLAARQRRIESDTTGTRRAVAQAETAVIRRALGEARDLGGHEQATSTRVPTTVRRLPGGARNGDSQTVRDLRTAEEWFPREWLELADDRGELLLGRGDRAQFLGDVGGRDLIVGVGEGRSYAGGFGSASLAGMVGAVAERMRVAVPGLARVFEAAGAGAVAFGAAVADVLGRGGRWARLAALVIAILLLL